MQFLAPFLINGKESDRAFALGLYDNLIQYRGMDLVEVEVLIDGSVVHRTGALRISSLRNHFSVYRGYARKLSSVKTRVRYTKIVAGFPYHSEEYIIWPPNSPESPSYEGPSGRVRVPINGPSVGSSRSYARARSRTQGFTKNPWIRREKASAKPLRPSPERIMRPFLGVLQNQSGLNESSIHSIRVYQREWSGSRTPGYMVKARTGTLPDNNHYVRLTQGGENRYSWYQVQPASGNYSYELKPFTFFYSVLDPPLDDTIASRIAVSKLIHFAEQGLNSNMAQNLAQYNQLFDLIAGNAMRMKSALDDVKRGNFSQAANTLTQGRKSRFKGPRQKPDRKKDVANNWLAFQYGWKPLLDDINGFMQTLSRLQTETKTVSRVSAKGESFRTVDVAYPPAPSADPNSKPGKTQFRLTNKVRYTIRYRVENSMHAFMSQLGFTNPINLFWEILPYSFVADWFVPIGPMLEQLTAFSGCTFLGGSKTSFTKVNMNSAIGYSGVHSASSTVNVLFHAAYSQDEVFLIRSGLTGFPSPILPTYHSDGLQHGNRAANAIALLTKAFK